MSRPIKFRVWDKTREKMGETTCLILHKQFGNADSACYQFENENGLTTKQGLVDSGIDGLGSDFELMQYTGLKDKNGKEIYEGDIVAQRDLIVDDIISVVEWGECDAGSLGDDDVPMHGWILQSKIYSICPLSPYPIWYEVIGNIYENKELFNE